MALLSCKDLVLGYEGKPLLPPVNLEIGKGEFWFVIGRNGSGKSTWLKTALGLLPPVAGELTKAEGVQLAYVPQKSSYDEIWPVTTEQVVGMGMERGLSFLGRAPTVDAASALKAVGAGDLQGRLFRSLSEGQKQRVLMARVIASHSQVVFLDEPTASMDDVAERDALEWMNEVRQKFGTTVIVVSHYLGAARQYADHVLFIDRESQKVVVGTADEIFAHETFVRSFEYAND